MNAKSLKDSFGDMPDPRVEGRCDHQAAALVLGSGCQGRSADIGGCRSAAVGRWKHSRTIAAAENSAE